MYIDRISSRVINTGQKREFCWEEEELYKSATSATDWKFFWLFGFYDLREGMECQKSCQILPKKVDPDIVRQEMEGDRAKLWQYSKKYSV